MNYSYISLNFLGHGFLNFEIRLKFLKNISKF